MVYIVLLVILLFWFSLPCFSFCRYTFYIGSVPPYAYSIIFTVYHIIALIALAFCFIVCFWLFTDGVGEARQLRRADEPGPRQEKKGEKMLI